MSLASSHSSRVVSMAGGTLVSRVTGLFRVLVLAWVLGFTPLADAFNLANTVPNMLFDLVLGGIATATFIPVFVERLALDGERRAWKSISNIVTGAVVILVAASLASWFLAPYIIDGFTFLQRTSSTHSASVLAHQKLLVMQQRQVATDLLRYFVPQIFFYGIIGVATALLNIRHRFGIATWVPVANNVVCIGVLVWFHLVDPNPVLGALNGSRDLLWLGLGTTAGVAVQFLCLVPSLARSELWRLSFRFDYRDPAVRTVARLGSWTLGVVVANQLSLYVVLAYAFGIGGNGPVSAYTYGWSFMQMPYAVVVVSVLGALTPQLAGFATAEDFEGLTERLRFGLRQSLVIIIPCTLVLIVLAQPIVAILLHHLNGTQQITRRHRARRPRGGTAGLHRLSTGGARAPSHAACSRRLSSLCRRERANDRALHCTRSTLVSRSHGERVTGLHHYRGRGPRRPESLPRQHHYRCLERPRAPQPVGVTDRGRGDGGGLRRSFVDHGDSAWSRGSWEPSWWAWWPTASWWCCCGVTLDAPHSKV